MSELVVKCQTEAMRLEEDALYSSKAHFEAGDCWKRLHLFLGIPAAVAATVAGISALKDYPTISAVLALSVAALSALITFLNPSARANSHLNAGNHDLSLRNRARMFCEIESVNPLDESELKNKLIQLSDRRDELNTGSPQIPRWAYLRAKRGIINGEATHKVDSDHS